MYYIENVVYFLQKKGFGQSNIDEVVEKLNSQTVNKITGNGGFVPSGSVKDVLDTQTYQELTEDFNRDEKHLLIVMENSPVFDKDE